MSANYYLADELANKVIYLSKALHEAHQTISILEQENQSLQDILYDISFKDDTKDFLSESVGSGN